jgi:PASTA domain
MRNVSWIVLAVGVWACSLSTRVGGSSFSSGGGGTSSSGSRLFTVPDVFGMTRAEAVAALQKAGYEGTASDDTSLCGSAVDGKIIELGHVCYQHPAAGQQMGTRLPMVLRVQTEDPRGGRIGEFGEWHLMPNVVGMPVDRALAALKKAGFTATEHNQVYEREKSGCAAGIVCEQYPEANTRSGLSSDRALTVGARPVVRPPPPPAAVDAGAPAAPVDAGAPDPGSMF